MDTLELNDALFIHSETSDKELHRRMLCGERKALEAFYEREAEELYLFAFYQIGKDNALAKERLAFPESPLFIFGRIARRLYCRLITYGSGRWSCLQKNLEFHVKTVKMEREF